jgi:hypothetical protein
VQGLIAAKLADSEWPRVRITEAHPKALLRSSPHVPALVKQSPSPDAKFRKRDAVLSAMAAMTMVEGTPGGEDLAL